MQEVIAVFKNRNQAMQFASALKRLGIKNKTINTPRELSSSCGVSIVFGKIFLNQAKIIIERLHLKMYVRLYVVLGELFKKYIPIN